MRKSKKPKKPAATFTAAPAAETMARPIVNEFHKHLNEHHARIEFLFRSDTKKRLGKTVAATAQRVTSLAAFFGRESEEDKVKPFFAIVISEPIWSHMESHERRALLDHELCHCGARFDNDGNSILYLIPHDLEEFRCIVERHGYWQRDVKLMAEAMERGQGVLPLDSFGARGMDYLDTPAAMDDGEKWRDCPKCKGLSKRNGNVFECGCGYSEPANVGAL